MRLERRGDVWLLIGPLVPPGAAAITLGRLILIRPERVDDERLLRHEMVHVRQWRELGVLGFLSRYLSSYLIWRLRGYSHWAAYRRIPLEIEAEWEGRQQG
jgi:hypothetical protein